tara:strand:- start:212 stop:439 length:228 start_codon:yes stop_codon:yes gene_type:complete
MSKEKEKMLDWYRIITLMEKSLLVVIAFLTAYAVIVEMFVVLSERAVKLTDLCCCLFMLKFWAWLRRSINLEKYQ